MSPTARKKSNISLQPYPLLIYVWWRSGALGCWCHIGGGNRVAWTCRGYGRWKSQKKVRVWRRRRMGKSNINKVEGILYCINKLVTYTSATLSYDPCLAPHRPNMSMLWGYGCWLDRYIYIHMQNFIFIYSWEYDHVTSHFLVNNDFLRQ